MGLNLSAVTSCSSERRSGSLCGEAVVSEEQRSPHLAVCGTRLGVVVRPAFGVRVELAGTCRASARCQSQGGLGLGGEALAPV